MEEKIIWALTQTTTVAAAADLAGCAQSTIFKKLNNPDFKKRYRQAAREKLKDSTAALQADTVAARATVREIMDDKKNPPKVRLKAAELILRHGADLTEKVDILEALDELEGEE